MTLLELSQEYAYSAELIARRMAQLRQAERQAEDEAVRFALHRWIWIPCCGNADRSIA